MDGAIHRAAGPQLLEACKAVRQQQGECPPGHAVITLAGDLPAKAVIHAVGPVWQGDLRNNGGHISLLRCFKGYLAGKRGKEN